MKVVFLCSVQYKTFGANLRGILYAANLFLTEKKYYIYVYIYSRNVHVNKHKTSLEGFESVVPSNGCLLLFVVFKSS